MGYSILLVVEPPDETSGYHTLDRYDRLCTALKDLATQHKEVRILQQSVALLPLRLPLQDFVIVFQPLSHLKYTYEIVTEDVELNEFEGTAKAV